jgi:hypothetical protein
VNNYSNTLAGKRGTRDGTRPLDKGVVGIGSRCNNAIPRCGSNGSCRGYITCLYEEHTKRFGIIRITNPLPQAYAEFRRIGIYAKRSGNQIAVCSIALSIKILPRFLIHCAHNWNRC